MKERLEKAIESVIYWSKVYTHNRTKFNKTENKIYDMMRVDSYIHLLASSDWLGQVYEEETGKKIRKIGNLPEFQNIRSPDSFTLPDNLING